MTNENKNIGFIGAGAVGGAMISQIVAESLPFNVRILGIKEISRPRKFLSLGVKTTGDIATIVSDPAIDIVIDVSRNFDTTEYISTAVANGKSVYQVNKDFYDGQDYYQIPQEILNENANAAALDLVSQIVSDFVEDES